MASRHSILRGDKELEATLRRLGRSAQNKELDETLFNALVPLRDETIRKAPRPSLKRSVVIAKVKSRGPTYREFWVSFKRGMGMRIAHLVELGTAPHSLAPGASRRYGRLQDVPPFHPGTPPEPFMRPAYEVTKGEVITEAGRGFWKFIVASVGRQAKVF